jgi:hypothetical protein
VSTTYLEFSSLDGTLNAIPIRGRTVTFIEEHGSGLWVRYRFRGDLVDRARAALGRRAVVEGLIRVSAGGQPLSMVDITSVYVRPQPVADLASLVGSAPDFTGGEDPVEYIRAMR